MKTIIAGSRTIHSYTTVETAIAASGFDITEVVSGCASGVDALGEEWAYQHHKQVMLFPDDCVDGDKPFRMARYSDACIIVDDGTFKETAELLQQAKIRGLKVFVYEA